MVNSCGIRLGVEQCRHIYYFTVTLLLNFTKVTGLFTNKCSKKHILLCFENHKIKLPLHDRTFVISENA